MITRLKTHIFFIHLLLIGISIGFAQKTPNDGEWKE